MARKQAAHGLTFIAAYTFSKALTDSSSAIYGSGGVIQDTYHMEKSIAAFDYPHFLKFTWIYELPFGHGRKWLNSNRGWDRLVSGWQITMIQNYHSGDPLSISSSIGTGINNPGLRADYVPGVPLTVASSGIDAVNGTQYLNPAAFTDPPASPVNGFALRYGNTPRFLPVRGPWIQSETAGLIKDTRLNERFTFQIRADAQNVFNRVVRGDPDTGLGDSTFGMITSDADGPRIIQLGVRLNF
jgi:hypothetical protein